MAAAGEGRSRNGLRAAVAFLTRVPAGRDAAAGVPRSTVWLPLVGALLGLGVAGVYAAAQLVLPALVSAVLGVAFGVAVTGGLHEDGLADSADGLGVPREDALRVMRDPRQGTFGVLALVGSLLLRVGAVASLGAVAALLWVPAAHAVSRAAAAGVLGFVGPAEERGLAAAFAGGARRPLAGLPVAGVIAILALAAWGAAALALAGALSVASGGWLSRRIGGATGDVLGAAQQVAEIGVLLLGSAAVAAWPSAGGWWA